MGTRALGNNRWWWAVASLGCAAVLSMAQTGSGPTDGLIVQQSDADFASTLARVEPAVKQRGLFVMRVMDHSASAAQFGRQLAPNTVVLFGNPQIGSQLMACEPRAGIDLPQKLLLWELDGAVMVAYNDPAYLVRRHSISGCSEIVAKIAENLRAIAAQVTGRASRPDAVDPVAEELRALFEADQGDRRHSTPPTPEEWADISQRDGARRDRVLELVRADALVSGADYYHAAMVLQHGQGAQDILTANILATSAAFLGEDRGKWLSAASLDRFLHRSEVPQRFGTQYVRPDSTEPWSQGAYDDWLPDSVRKVFNVPGRAQQIERVAEMNRGGVPD